MKTIEEIKNRIKEIDNDERYHYAPASVDINAPLALMQVALEATVEALAWVIDEKPPKQGPRGK